MVLFSVRYDTADTPTNRIRWPVTTRFGQREATSTTSTEYCVLSTQYWYLYIYLYYTLFFYISCIYLANCVQLLCWFVDAVYVLSPHRWPTGKARNLAVNLPYSIHTSAMATARRILFPLAWHYLQYCIKICKYVVTFEVNTWSVQYLYSVESNWLAILYYISILTLYKKILYGSRVQWYLYSLICTDISDGYIFRVTYIQILNPPVFGPSLRRHAVIVTSYTNSSSLTNMRPLMWWDQLTFNRGISSGEVLCCVRCKLHVYCMNYRRN